MSKQFGFDINNQGESAFARGAVEIAPAYFNGVVEDIIINEKNGEVLRYKLDGSNIGEALVRIVPDDWGTPREDLKSAFPLEMNIQEFPLVGEQVVVFKAFGALFYTRKLNSKRKLTENTSNVLFNTFKSNTPDEKSPRELAIAGIKQNTTAETSTFNRTFAVNPNTRPLRANEGDLIISGRFGNFIRLGSNLFKDPTTSIPQPNILLTAGAWQTPRQLSTNQITPYSLAYENINNDKSSIWMVSDQVVPFVAATAKSVSPKKAHRVSAEIPVPEYNGAQIFINSDRVILNSKLNEISLFSNREINLSAIKSITLDSESSLLSTVNKDISLTAGGNITLTGRRISLISTDDLSYKTSGNYSIIGKKIFIGRYADTTHPMVSGAVLSLWLQALVSALLSPGAVLTSTGPASFNPTIITLLTTLKTQLGNSVTPQSAVFNSRDNFTSVENG